MALPITIPFTFGNATTTQNLSSLDTDFSTVYNAVNGIGNGTVSLANVSITNGKATFSTANVSSGNWLPALYDDTTYSTFYSLTNPNSTLNSQNVPQVAVLAAAESTSVTPVGATPRALETVSFNRSLNGCTTWSVYLEAHRGLSTENVGSSALGQTYGIELEVINYGNSITGWNPYYTPGNGTIGMSIEVGAGQSPTSQANATCALYIDNNTNPTSSNVSFGAGLLIFDGAIGPYGSGGSKPAIVMPYDNQIQWYTPGITGNLSAAIVSDATGNLNLISSNNAVIVNGYSGISFVTNSTNQGFFDVYGNLLIGGMSAYNFNYTGNGVQIGGSNSSYTIVSSKSTTANTNQIAFNNPNGNVGSINTSGSNTIYATSSDYRLKENVKPMTNGLETISSLNPVIYNWIVDKTVGEGFIAHELQSVIPHAVSGEKDAVNEDGSIKPQGVDYSMIVVHLVAAIQELEARLAALESK